MEMLTVLQFTEQLLAYCGIMLFLPWLILRKRLRALPAAARLAAYFISGNMYVICLVFLLQFFRISGRLTLMAGTLLPFVVIILKKYGLPGIKLRINRALELIAHLLKGEYGFKTLIFKSAGGCLKKQRISRAELLRLLPDILLAGLLIAGVIYIYGYNTFHMFGYKASDLPVHNYWVNMMDDNDVFGAGVYPHGFHCIIYYMHTVFGIKTYILFRVFALVQTIFIHLSLLVSLKLLCRSRYTPYIGTVLYLVADTFSVNTYHRFAATLPQEYGMMFIFPAACFAIRFLWQYSLSQPPDKASHKKEKLSGKSRMYLIFFICSFSLTLSVHFYNTMVAGVFCAGIAAGFCFWCFRWRYMKKIAAAGLLSIFIAVMPMLIGLMLGRGLEGSLYWGMNVINGTAGEELQQVTTMTDDAGNQVTIVGDMDKEILEEIKAGTMTDSGVLYDSGHTWENFGPPGLGKRIMLKLESVRNDIQSDVFSENRGAVIVVFACTAIVIVTGAGCLVFHKKSYGGMLLSVGFYMIFMCVMQSLKLLGLPELMDSARCSIFFAYSSGLVLSVAADALIAVSLGRLSKKWVSSAAAVCILAAGIIMAVKTDEVKDPKAVSAQAAILEPNEAVICLTNIIRENEDFTWTIVSANDELRMTEKFAYHYEITAMLQQMEDMSENPEIKIPTDTVYFFVEKQPVDYAVSAANSKSEENGSVSEAWAKKQLPEADGINAYSDTNRWITMSRMYYWAEAFRKLYPNEMEIYFETDAFVCYRLRQNDYSLYNLAIDYGYNGMTASDTGR